MMGKFCTGLGPMSPCSDRFIPGGYHPPLSPEDAIRMAARIEGLEAVELVYPGDFSDGARMKAFLDGLGLAAAIVEIDTSTHPKWKYGAFTAPDPAIRREMMETAKRGIDETAKLGADRINLWLGQDGFDYPFQIDYAKCWEEETSALEELAAYRPDIKICVEYKLKEPRTHMLLSTVGKTLAIVNAVGRPNIGVNIDVGHALAAYENPAESAVLLARHGRLFHLHLNDNHRYWDDDLVVGSIHFWETLELFYWLRRIGYDDWLSLDIWPSREDQVDALRAMF